MRKDIMHGIICVLAVAVLIGRLMVPGHDLSWPGTYEAFAHLIIGFFIGLCFIKEYRTLCLGAIIFLTIFETIMFFTR